MTSLMVEGKVDAYLQWYESAALSKNYYLNALSVHRQDSSCQMTLQISHYSPETNDLQIIHSLVYMLSSSEQKLNFL